jgi:hypothetical protein
MIEWWDAGYWMEESGFSPPRHQDTKGEEEERLNEERAEG